VPSMSMSVAEFIVQQFRPTYWPSVGLPSPMLSFMRIIEDTVTPSVS